MQFRNLRNVTLDEQDGFFRTNSGCQQVERHVVCVLPQVDSILDGGQGVQIYNAIDAIIIILQSDIILDCAQIVTQMSAPGGADAGKDAAFFSHNFLTILFYVSSQ